MTKQKEEVHVSKEDINNGKGLALICYIIAIIPFFAEKDNDFVKYHAKQGMNLFVVDAIYIILNSALKPIVQIKTCTTVCFYDTPWIFSFISGLISIILLIFSGIGMYNVIREKVVPLPLISKLNLFK